MIRKCSLTLAACTVGYCVVGYAVAAPPYASFAETQTIKVANAGPFEDLGWSLDASGALAISGALNGKNAANQTVGAAYVYRQAPGGQWNQVAKLLATDGVTNDSFGYSVGLDGDTAIVGASSHDVSSTRRGATYLFHRNTDSDWQEVGKFVAPADTTNFGFHISISGTRAVASGIRSSLFNQKHGVVEVLEQSGPSSWSQVQHIEWMGQSTQVNDVSIEDGTLFVAGYQQMFSGGPTTYSVEVYDDSTAGFVHSASILAPITSSSFGSSISIDQDRLLVGASRESGHGAAYIFERDASDAWTQVAHLMPSDIDQRFLVGTEVALHGDFAFVNSWNSPNGLGDGRVYVFQRNDIGNWVEIAKLSSPQGQITFGHSLDAVDGQVLIGSGTNTPGAVHVFSEVPEPGSIALVGMIMLCLARVSPIRGARRRW